MRKHKRICKLCSRPVRKMTNHHPLPQINKRKRSFGSTEHGEKICADCHRSIHFIFSNRELRAIGKRGIHIWDYEAYRSFFPLKVLFLEKYLSIIKNFNAGSLRKPKEFFYMVENDRIEEMRLKQNIKSSRGRDTG